MQSNKETNQPNLGWDYLCSFCTNTLKKKKKKKKKKAMRTSLPVSYKTSFFTD